MYQAKEEKSIKSSRGITLIALIITIIVYRVFYDKTFNGLNL